MLRYDIGQIHMCAMQWVCNRMKMIHRPETCQKIDRLEETNVKLKQVRRMPYVCIVVCYPMGRYGKRMHSQIVLKRKVKGKYQASVMVVTVSISTVPSFYLVCLLLLCCSACSQARAHKSFCYFCISLENCKTEKTISFPSYTPFFSPHYSSSFIISVIIIHALS